MSNIARMMQRATAGAGGAGLDVDEVFSCHLYEGNNSTQTITNGIDLSGEGGLVWIKNRSTGSTNHSLFDTVSGATGGSRLRSNLSNALQNFSGSAVFTTSSTGFALNSTASQDLNDGSDEYASWTFRKALKFFDVVTYTGNGSAGRQIAHNLGTTVGMLVVKRTDSTGDWSVFHRKLNGGTNSGNYRVELQGTVNESTTSHWNNTVPSSTHFTVGNSNTVNGNGNTYVAYLFAHNNNDGEFGPDSDQDIIKCGSYTGNAGNPQLIELGFEPQFLMVKCTTNSGDWFVVDNMRGVLPNADYGDANKTIYWNKSDAEIASGNFGFYSTGFAAAQSSSTNGSGRNFIYMAIRRGSLFKPTNATKVFAIDTKNSTGDNKTPLYRSGFPVDLALLLDTDGGSDFPQMHPRLTSTKYLRTNNTAVEQSGSAFTHDFMNGFRTDTSFSADTTRVCHMWKRAPGYFDVVAYEGTSSTQNITHNLGVKPDMMWIKSRSNANSWIVYHKDQGATKRAFLHSTQAFDTAGAGIFNNTEPTATQFTVATDSNTNYSGHRFIAYLFATVAGVSKVGSFSHSNGSGDTNVDCGFSSGARFVLYKQYDSSGSWYVLDSVRGIVAGNDPALLLNSTAAEDSSYDQIDPLSSGFTIPSAGVGTGDYIFYAIA